MELYAQMLRFCLYRERSLHEVQIKLAALGAEGDEAEAMLAQLQAEHFVDETRFANEYVHSKYSLKKWGRRKIRYGLQQHHVSEALIYEALAQIDEERYEATILRLLERKYNPATLRGDINRRASAQRYLLQKGYEPELIARIMRSFIK